MPTAPSEFPLLGAPQALGDWPNLLEGSKNLGWRPPEAEGIPQAPRHTRLDPCLDNTAGQSATQHLERSSPKSISLQKDLDRGWSSQPKPNEVKMVLYIDRRRETPVTGDSICKLPCLYIYMCIYMGSVATCVCVCVFEKLFLEIL